MKEKSETLKEVCAVFLVGFSKEELFKIRSNYNYDKSSFDTHFYGFKEGFNFINRLGVCPKVLFLNKQVRIIDSLRSYILLNRISVLKTLDIHKPLALLSDEDYYGGVYDTISYDNLSNPIEITSAIDLGIRIFHRNRDEPSSLSDYVKNSIEFLQKLRIEIQNLTEVFNEDIDSSNCYFPKEDVIN